jgi:hypothetical protein
VNSRKQEHYIWGSQKGIINNKIMLHKTKYSIISLIMRKLKSDELFKNILKKILIFKMYYRVEMFYNNDTKITNNDVLIICFI